MAFGADLPLAPFGFDRCPPGFRFELNAFESSEHVRGYGQVCDCDVPDVVREEPMAHTKRTITEAFDRWKGALIDQDKQVTQAARHRAHARVTSMEDLIAETPADDIEGVGIKLALYIYMSGVDPEKADSAVEQVLSAYQDCVRVVGRDLLAEVKCLMPPSQQSV
jgi:hypothetical protein